MFLQPHVLRNSRLRIQLPHVPPVGERPRIISKRIYACNAPHLHGGGGGIPAEQVADEARQVVLGRGQERLQLGALRRRVPLVLAHHREDLGEVLGDALRRVAQVQGLSWIRVRGYHKQYSFFCEGTVRCLEQVGGDAVGRVAHRNRSRAARARGCSRGPGGSYMPACLIPYEGMR